MRCMTKGKWRHDTSHDYNLKECVKKGCTDTCSLTPRRRQSAVVPSMRPLQISLTAIFVVLRMISSTQALALATQPTAARTAERRTCRHLERGLLIDQPFIIGGGGQGWSLSLVLFWRRNPPPWTRRPWPENLQTFFVFFGTLGSVL